MADILGRAQYASDGKCHNSEPGTFNHECGKPATWIGRKPSQHTESGWFESGFCDDCKARGWEARAYHDWRRVDAETNPARAALSRAVNRAIADGAPVYVNKPE